MKPGPAETGFDYHFLLPATGDRVPKVYLEQGRVVHLAPNDLLFIRFTDDAADPNPFGGPTGLSHPRLLRQPADTQHSGAIVNGISRIGFQSGGAQALWKDEDFPSLFVKKAREFISRHKNQPFFLYFNPHDIHVPRIVSPEFEGKSSLGPRGDAILQLDWTVGQLMETLRQLGMDQNTLVIFSSDNGPVLDDGYGDQAASLLGQHQPAGPYRGGKYSAYEAGTRVPALIWFPKRIPAGVSNALWSHTDLYASLAALVGHALEDGEAPDSENVWPALSGRSQAGRTWMLEEAFTFGVRRGKWKYIAPTEKRFPWIEEVKQIEGGISTLPQLFDLETDPGERINLAQQYPEVAAACAEYLKAIGANPE